MAQFEDFKTWTSSPALAEAHENRAPQEMFRGKNERTIHEVFLSSDLSA